MKVGSVLKLIAVASIGMGTATWVVRDPGMAASYFQAPWGPWLKDLADGFVGGVAIAGCVGIWIERARGRSPLPWGPGRWVWSVVGLYLLIHYCLTYTYHSSGDLAGVVGGLAAGIRMQLIFWLRDAPAYVVVAVAITYLGATPGSGPRPDSREWAGRILGATIIASGVIHPFRFAIDF